MRSEVKYLLCPGWVTSKTDGDQHFISASDLIRLYGVRRDECVDVRDARGIDTDLLIDLCPRYDGEYTTGENNE